MYKMYAKMLALLTCIKVEPDPEMQKLALCAVAKSRQESSVRGALSPQAFGHGAITSMESEPMTSSPQF